VGRRSPSQPLDGCFQLGAITWFHHSERKPLLEAWPGWIVRLGDAELLDRISGMCAELILLSANDSGAEITHTRGRLLTLPGPRLAARERKEARDVDRIVRSAKLSASARQKSHAVRQ
jgi:hypothetical protein